MSNAASAIRIGVLTVLFLSTLSPIAVHGQFTATWVQPTGGEQVKSQGHSGGITIGQPFAGKMSSTSYRAGVGFWYQVRRVAPVNGTPGGTTPLAGGSLELSGTGLAATTDPVQLESDQVTVEAWVKHDGSSDADAVILTKSRVGTSALEYELSLEGSGEEVPVRFSALNEISHVISRIGVPAHHWTHVAGTYDGQTLSIYVDGELAGTRTRNQPHAIVESDVPLIIGAGTERDRRFFSGQIDEVRIWNRARSDAEIRSTLARSLHGNEPDLRAYYPFTDDVADRAGTYDLETGDDIALSDRGVFPLPPRLYARNGNAAVSLGWESRFSGQPASEVQIYRSSTRDGSDLQRLTSLPAVQSQYVDDENIENGRVYRYQIASVDAEGNEGELSSMLTATPYETRGGASLSLSGTGYAMVTGRPSISVGVESGDDEDLTPVTVEAWIKHDGSSDPDAIILTKHHPRLSGLEYQLALVGGGEEVRARFFANNDIHFVTSRSGIPANRWTHLAGVSDGEDLSIYIDGELDATSTPAVTPTISRNNAPLRIGSNHDLSGAFFSGRIDEIRLWDVARSPEQIRQHMNIPLTGGEAGLRVNLRFDDPGATSQTERFQNGLGTVDLDGDAAVSPGGVFPLPPTVFARPDDQSAQVLLEDRNRAQGANRTTSFELFRSIDRDSGDRDVIASLPAVQDAFGDSGLLNGRWYIYDATSTNAGGQTSDIAPAASITAQKPRAAHALELDGEGDYAVVSDRPSTTLGVPSSYFDVTTPLTVEAWIRHEGAAQADPIILTKHRSESSALEYQFTLVGTGKELPVRFYAGNDLYSVTSTTALQPEEWVHVAGTYDGESLAIYVNGVLEDTRRLSAVIRESDADLTFGADSDGSGPYFRGQIDEVRIWDVARTQEELDAMATVPLFGNEDGLRAYFRFDEPAGQTAYGSTRGAMRAHLQDDARFTAAGSPVPIESAEELPEHFTLEGNYPNPFNPSTTIRYGLAEGRTVRLELFDVLGRRVAVLIDGERKPAGWHELRFDATRLPSGSYLYRLTAGDFTDTGKMMLLK